MNNSMVTTTVILLLLVVVLAACGGGSSGPTAVSTKAIVYPDCPIGVGGVDDLAGCWISDQSSGCVSGLNTFTPLPADRVQNYRYLAEITQTGTAPSITGGIKDYFLVYAKDDYKCEKAPVDIIDMAEFMYDEGLASLGHPISNTTSYEIASNELCDTNISGTLEQIPCVAIDATVTYAEDGVANDPALTLSTYYIADDGMRICVPIGDYTPGFDLLHLGVLFNSGWSAYRLNNIFMSADNCLTRFSPPV